MTSPAHLLINKWDFEGNGYIDVSELEQALSTFSPGGLNPSLSYPYREEILGRFRNSVNNHAIGRNVTPELLQLIVDDTLGPDSWVELETHVLSVLEFQCSLTETAQKTRAIWELFDEWSDGEEYITYTNVLAVVCSIQPFVTDPAAVRVLLCNVSPSLYSREERKITLKQFHKFINALMTDVHWHNHEFFTSLRDIRQALNVRREQSVTFHHAITEHTQNKKTQNLLAAQRHKVQMSRVNKRRSEVQIERLNRLKSELRHSLDGVTPNDVAKIFDIRDPPVWIQIVIAPLCVLLDIQPLSTWQDDYFAALKQYIASNSAEAIIKQMQRYNFAHVSEDMLQAVLAFYFNPEFDPRYLLKHSVFISAACSWIKVVVRLVCMEHGWEFMPNVPLSNDSVPLIPNTVDQTPAHHPLIQQISAAPQLTWQETINNSNLIAAPRGFEEEEQPELLQRRASTMTSPMEPLPQTPVTYSVPATPTVTPKAPQEPPSPSQRSVHQLRHMPQVAHPFVRSSLDIRRQHTLSLEPILADTRPEDITRICAATSKCTLGYNITRAQGSLVQAALKATPRRHRASGVTYSPVNRQLASPYSPLVTCQSASIASDMLIRRTTENSRQLGGISQALDDELTAYHSPFVHVEPEQRPPSPRAAYLPSTAAVFGEMQPQ